MGYLSDRVATTVGRLNVSYFLPAIQREFVWHPEQVVRLFDSLLRGYPISSFLFWESSARAGATTSGPALRAFSNFSWCWTASSA
jgi:hypothetical protein